MCMFKYSFNELSNCMPFQQNDQFHRMFMAQNILSNADVHSKCSIAVGRCKLWKLTIFLLEIQMSFFYAAPHIRHHLNHFERTHSFHYVRLVETADSFCQKFTDVCVCMRVVCIFLYTILFYSVISMFYFELSINFRICSFKRSK